MKNLSKIMFVAALAASFSLVNQASAQYRAVGDDGIAASPKVREMLDQRKAAANTPAAPTVVVTQTTHKSITASPRATELLERNTVVSTPAVVSTSGGYQPTGSDGITASPKARQMIDEQHKQFMVAPLK
jgi:hypothetical protein